jgi:hypothetical protein
MINYTDYAFMEISASVIEQSMTHFRNKGYMCVCVRAVQWQWHNLQLYLCRGMHILY